MSRTRLTVPRLVLLTLLMLPLGAFAQRNYVDMMQDSIVDYAATVKAFEKFWEGRTPEKGQGHKAFLRWAYINGLRVQPDGKLPPVGAEAQEVARWRQEEGNQRRTNTVPTGNWSPLGPFALPTNNTGQPGGIARTTTIAFHPTLSGKLYCGTPSGGLWISSDAGLSWTQSNTDFLPTLGVSAILVDPITPTTIYIGTGDKDAGDASGLGVYKSTNDGLTWTVSNTGMGNRTVHSLTFDPNDNTKLIATTNNGIYRSTNSGANWTQVLASGTTYQVGYQPASNTVLYAVNATRLYKSTDDGATWNAGVVISTSARAAFAVTPADANVIYVVKDVGANPVFKSTDAGATFTNVQTDSKVLLNASCAGTGTGGQGWYDICIAVDPGNSNIVLVGGVSLWKSTDGGQNFNTAACWSSMVSNVHADHHFLAYSPHFASRLYDCNDGGLYYTSDAGVSYTNLSSGIAASMLYRAAVSGHDPSIAIGGLQDNGMNILRQGNWITTAGGDGLECAIDPTDDNFQYGSYVSGVIRRSTNGGYNWSNISGVIPETGPWLTPYTLQPGNPNVMLAGYVSLWRSADVKSAAPTFTNVQSFATDYIRDIHFADANTVYMSRDNGEFWRSLDAGLTWTQVTNPPGGTADDIAADPATPTTLWVASGNDIYRSTDGGTTWAIWDTGLPNVAALTIVFDHVANALYCGMWNGGVFYRQTTDPSWTAFSTGLPNTQAIHLQIFYDQTGCVGRDKLRLATYGRGLWESDLRAGATLPPVACFGADTTAVCAQIEVLQLRDSSAYDPTSWLWTITGPGAVTYTGGTSSTSQNPQVTLGAVGLYTISLQATNGNGSDTKTRVSYVNAVLPAVAFTTPDTLIYVGQSATFTDASAACVSSRLWDFGDGFTSTATNPSHTYATAGLYTVTLTVNGGVNARTKANLVQVLPHLAVPYTSTTAGWSGDMENDATAWHYGDKRMSGSNNPWERGSVVLTFPTAASGTKAWATDLDANVPVANYATAVYTPTFDMSGAGTYQLRLKTAMQSVFCNAPIGVVLDYTTDQGATWTRLGGKQGTDPAAYYNWFSHGGTGGCDNIDVVPAPRIGWNFSNTGSYRQAIYDASALAGTPRVGFRLAFYSSSAYGAFTSKGFAFDDFELDYLPTISTDTVPGRLIAFDGVNDYVETYYNGNPNPFTIEAWVMSPTAPAASTRTSILQKSNVLEFNWNHPSAGPRGAVALRNSAGTFQNYTFGPLAANTWYHLAVTFDGTTVKTYKNGLLVTSAAFTGPLTVNTNTWQMGNGGGAFFNGQIDEFRMWNVVRTEQEIREAMHRTLDPGECANVLTYLQSNEASGYLRDATHLRNGYLQGGLGRALSPIAVGRGVSQSLTVSGLGLQNFNIPQLQLDFTSAAGTPFDITVTRINQFVNQQTPNPAWNAAPNATLVDRNLYFYHVINKFGGGAFSANAIVQGVPDISSAEVLTPSYLKWVKRVSTSVGVWDVGIPAAAATFSSGFNGTATFNNVTSFSQAFIGSEVLDVLPVSVTLRALPDPDAQAIQLAWEAVEETGLTNWTLERALSPEALARGEGLVVSTQVAGQGNYGFEDRSVDAGQTYYYRVRSTDANLGTYQSQVVEARLDGSSPAVRVFPNPNTGAFYLDLATNGENAQLKLTDASGSLVWQNEVATSPGLSRIEVKPTTVANGMYFLEVNWGTHHATAKVVIAH